MPCMLIVLLLSEAINPVDQVWSWSLFQIIKLHQILELEKCITTVSFNPKMHRSQSPTTQKSILCSQ